jgi:prepilin-type N-terminal cleavage/methylation domain-containing protein
MIKFKITQPSLKNKKAYTLIELSITILIISLLMAGVFSFATGSINNAKSALTKQRMDEIYKSMGTYLMVNKRLPCPASILTSKVNDANYGQEVAVGAGCEGVGVYKSSTNADLFFGGVPIRALNLSSEYAEDGYGNKFNYIIDRRFTYNFINTGSTTENITPSFGTVASANNVITVKEKQSSNDLSRDVIFILSSAGENGLGAFNAESGLQNIGSIEAEENNNQLPQAPESPTTFDNIFIVNSSGSEDFDDIVFYQTREGFVIDFSARNLIYCSALKVLDVEFVTDTDFTKRNLYYGQYLYADSACSTNSERIKIIRCGIDNKWSPKMVSCPPPAT